MGNIFKKKNFDDVTKPEQSGSVQSSAGVAEVGCGWCSSSVSTLSPGGLAGPRL